MVWIRYALALAQAGLTVVGLFVAFKQRWPFTKNPPSDGRTVVSKRTFRVGLALALAAGGGTGYVSWDDDKSSSSLRDDVIAARTESKASHDAAEVSAKESAAAHAEATVANAKLDSVRAKLNDVAIAVDAGSGADVVAAVQTLRRRADDAEKQIAESKAKIGGLEVSADKAARGETEHMDFQGNVTRTQYGSPKTAPDLPSRHEFDHMTDLQFSKTDRWHELLIAAQAAEKRQPSWSAPHYFLGLYFEHVGRKADALRELQAASRLLGESDHEPQITDALNRVNALP